MNIEQLQDENAALKLDISSQQKEILYLKNEIASLRKMIYGAKREKFKSNQTLIHPSLFDDLISEAASTENSTTPPQSSSVTSQENAKAKQKKKLGRNTFPAHIPREETLIEPSDIDTSKMECIGQDITELLAYVPGQLKVKKIIRPRYANKSQEQSPIHQAPIPDRLIPKGTVDESLIAHLMVEKICYHTPIHRLHKKIKQGGIHFLQDKTLHSWLHRGAEALMPLWHMLKQACLDTGYIQADESGFKVLNKNKVGSSHRGQMWVIYQPKLKICYFQYDPSRSQQAAQALIPSSFKGTIQSDGYQAYEYLKKTNPCDLIYCMAHGRRKFIIAQEAGYELAHYYLQEAQKLYNIERQAREHKLNPQDRQALRQTLAVPILQRLHEWLKQKADDPKVLPGSPLGKAINYNLKRWKGLMAYAYDGRLEIDNNLIENQIRPLALGRKNYLFAKTNDTAQNLAVLYSIIGSAKMHDLQVEPYIEWLLRKTVHHKIDDSARNWLPHQLSPDLIQKFKLKS